MTQKEAILDALLDGETLTPLEILKRFDCLSGAQRVSNLRANGNPHNIQSELRKVDSGKLVAHYFIPHATSPAHDEH